VGASVPFAAGAQTPKRGGTLTLRTWDPRTSTHLAHAYKTRVVISFTHSRLLRHRAGPGVRPGAFTIEGDVAESWQQTSDTTYVFKLRKGVRFHAKPPVNGREITADDVRYTFERILTDKGSANVSMYRSIAKIEPLDRYTVRFTLKEPFAWFLDMIANPMSGAIIARSAWRRSATSANPRRSSGPAPTRSRPTGQRVAHAGAQPRTTRAHPALHRSRRDAGGRGQRLAHRRVPRRQVRSRMGVPRHDQPLRLDPAGRHAEEAAPGLGPWNSRRMS
jgi:ABC-type transport system substrate-binding protein